MREISADDYDIVAVVTERNELREKVKELQDRIEDLEFDIAESHRSEAYAVGRYSEIRERFTKFSHIFRDILNP